MRQLLVVAMAVMLVAAVLPALAAADQASDLKALKDQVKSLQDANVVMKEDLAKTQLQMAELAQQNKSQAKESAAERDALSKQIAELRQALADEKAAHQAAMEKERAEHEAALKAAQAEAARQHKKAKERQLWLYVAGAIGLGLVLAH